MLQTITRTITLDEVLEATIQRATPILDEVLAKSPIPNRKPTFITDAQKKYIIDLRAVAQKLNLNTIADKKVHNRNEASSYIGQLRQAIQAENKRLAEMPKPKAKGCGCGIKR